MASRLNRARAMRTAVAVAAVAAPLAAAGSAQAAIAGASPASTTNLPDLVSAASTGANTMQVCFDKALTAANSTVTVGTSSLPAFTLSNYLSGTNLAGANNAISPYGVTVDATKSNCADLTFNQQSGQLDLGQGSIITAAAGAVSSSGGSNLADSTTVTSGTSNTGTEGHTAGPDLTSVKIGASSTAPSVTGNVNTLVYTFDKNVDPSNIQASDFQFDYTSGTVTESAVGTTATVSGNTVTVDFTGESVANATVAYVQPGAVYSAESSTGASTNEVPNPIGSFVVNGIATVPTLTGASLVAGTSSADPNAYDTVTYTFDHTITGTPSPTQFFVTLSDGDTIASSAATASGNTVTATFNDKLSPVAEYAVQAYVTGTEFGGTAPSSAVGTTAATPDAAVSATPSSAPIGGNAGLLDRGYTTGPDVQAVVNEGLNNLGQPQYLVYVDQRVASALGTTAGTGTQTIANTIELLSPTGSVVDSDPSITVGPSSGPGQQQLLLTFNQNQTFFGGNGTQISFPVGVFNTSVNNVNGGPATDGQNVVQIDSITATAAHAKGIKMHKATKKHVARKRVARKHIARKHVTKKHGR